MSLVRKNLGLFLALSLILGTHQGYIALWDTAASQPIEVYPYKVALLPPREASQLILGIPIRDEAQLKDLLMNFLS